MGNSRLQWANFGLSSRGTRHVVLLCSFSLGSLAAVTNVGANRVKQRLWGESLVLGFWVKPETESVGIGS